MNRFKLILVSVIVVTFFVGLILYLSRGELVNIRVADGVGSSTVYIEQLTDSDYIEVSTLTGNSALRLRNGEYRARTAATDTFAEFTKTFTVSGKSVDVLIDPGYSDEKLATLLKTESNAINQVIARKLNLSLNQGYEVQERKLLKKGEWLVAVITRRLSKEELRLSYVDVYRIILTKKDDTWELVTPTPELHLFVGDYPDTPHDVVVSANELYTSDD